MRVYCIGNVEGESHPLEVGTWYDVNIDEADSFDGSIITDDGDLQSIQENYNIKGKSHYDTRWYLRKYFLTEQQFRDKKLKDILG